MKVVFVTHGCKANQYDTERFRQELQARGATWVDKVEDADAIVVNTCTVTNAADAEARKAIRKAKRQNPDVEIIVAGCSAAMKSTDYLAMPEVSDVIAGHDPQKVANAIGELFPDIDTHEEVIGGTLLKANLRGHRGWLKIQDGCDRRCAFCATKVARGVSRSRSVDEVVAEAKILSESHRELVLTGVHIGHYGKDLEPTSTLGVLLEKLVNATPDTRYRLGSIEATEIDSKLGELVTQHPQVARHLHIPMQSGADHVLRLMQRWHTRSQYRDRVQELADATPYIGLGADIIVGFPGEREQDFAQTKALVEELPFTYLHVFPYSVRDGTKAATMPDKVPGNVAAERSRILRDIASEKATSYLKTRAGMTAQIVAEDGQQGLTEDYLRVSLPDDILPGMLVERELTLHQSELVVL